MATMQPYTHTITATVPEPQVVAELVHESSELLVVATYTACEGTQADDQVSPRGLADAAIA